MVGVRSRTRRGADRNSSSGALGECRRLCAEGDGSRSPAAIRPHAVLQEHDFIRAPPPAAAYGLIVERKERFRRRCRAMMSPKTFRP